MVCASLRQPPTPTGILSRPPRHWVRVTSCGCDLARVALGRQPALDRWRVRIRLGAHRGRCPAVLRVSKAPRRTAAEPFLARARLSGAYPVQSSRVSPCSRVTCPTRPRIGLEGCGEHFSELAPIMPVEMTSPGCKDRGPKANGKAPPRGVLGAFGSPRTPFRVDSDLRVCDAARANPRRYSVSPAPS